MRHMQINKCIPWDYPLPRGTDSLPICTSYYDGTTEYNNTLNNFNAAMGDPHIMQNCTEACSPNCDEVTYSYEMDTTYLEVDKLCYEGEKTRDVMNLT